MKRLYTFGCSFTNYKWPTWADILGREFDHYENWGQCGAGNQFIFNSITECLIKNKFTKDDIFIIMWTNVTREDRYVNGHWLTPGNIYTQDDTYDAEFIKKFVDIRGCYLRDLATIHATKKMLDSYGLRYIFTSMVPINNYDQYLLTKEEPGLTELFDCYANTIAEIRPSVFESIFNYDWTSRPFGKNTKNLKKLMENYQCVAGTNWPSFDIFYKNIIANNFKDLTIDIRKEISDPKWNWEWKVFSSKRIDNHPTPSEHLEYINKVLPEFNISDDTKNWISTINDAVLRKHECDSLWEQSHQPNRW